MHSLYRRIYVKVEVDGEGQHPLYEFLKDSCPQTVNQPAHSRAIENSHSSSFAALVRAVAMTRVQPIYCALPFMFFITGPVRCYLLVGLGLVLSLRPF